MEKPITDFLANVPGAKPPSNTGAKPAGPAAPGSNVPRTPSLRSAGAPPLRKPEWLRVKVPQGERFAWIKERARSLNLHTVCEEARCPNIGECWQGGTATFMLMGDTCTRGCRFCSVKTLRNPEPLDASEPQNIAETIREMGLDYVVLTTVNRDELADQGSTHIAETMTRTQAANPELLIEVLIPDFRGDHDCLERVIRAKPAVIAHNVETVERLTPVVRDPRAHYRQSLDVLDYLRARAAELGIPIKTKSSIMLGLGETDDEVRAAMTALRGVGTDFLTLGQYLQPDPMKLKVVEYVTPERFKALENEGQAMGFAYVASGPLVRSSYRAAEFYIRQALQKEREVRP